jgi:hypothetical protein
MLISNDYGQINKKYFYTDSCARNLWTVYLHAANVTEAHNNICIPSSNDSKTSEVLTFF